MDKIQSFSIVDTPGEIHEPTMQLRLVANSPLTGAPTKLQQLHIVRGPRARQVWVDVPVIVDATEFRRG